MRSLSAKRIAAVAASLLVGLAAAGQGVNFGSIPIINTAGQPVVQIVIGSKAQPSDGVVAANIAAVIGSLAHTSTTVTASISGRSGVSCVVTTPTCTLSNAEVWLGEQGLVVPTGSYSFSALIGSVLNPGVLNSGNLRETKTPWALNTTSGTNYAYPGDTSSGPYPITSSPTATSAWAGIGLSPNQTISSSYYGGVQFNKFTANSLDSVLELTNAAEPQLALLSNAGSAGEYESLWLAGFPVYDNYTGALSVLDTQGAYLATFAKPITNTSSNFSTGEQISLLGKNWTVYNLHPPVSGSLISNGGSTPTSNSFVLGGNVTLAQATTKPTIVYVGHNITSGPFTVVLNDLSYPDSNGLANAALTIYKNGVLSNVTSVGPASGGGNGRATINATGTKLYIHVNQTFPGLYAYQKWAKIQLFSNVLNVTNGKDFNYSADGHAWVAALRWTTNRSSASQATPYNAALQGIVLYTNDSTGAGGAGYQPTLVAGSTYDYITNPAAWQVEFAGESLGTPGSSNSNYDPLTLSTTTGKYTYSNVGVGGAATATVPVNTIAVNGLLSTASGSQAVNTTAITEEANLFEVGSSLSNAFQLTVGNSQAAPPSAVSTVTYNLNPYVYTALNSINAAGTTNVLASGHGGLWVQIVTGTGYPVNSINGNDNLVVDVSGYKSGATSPSGESATFSNSIEPGNQVISGFAPTNVVDVTLSHAIPGVTVNVWESANAFVDTGGSVSAMNMSNSILMGTLAPASSPSLLYQVSQYSYYQAPTTTTTTYTGEGTNVNFNLLAGSPSTSARAQYFTYDIPEITVPGASAPDANVIVGISNATGAPGTDSGYMLNWTGSHNQAFEYQGSNASISPVIASQGFRTERGGYVSTISSKGFSATYDEPRSVDGLQFVVGPVSSASANGLTTKVVGPFTKGESVTIPGVSNVTIANVSAKCTFSTTSCNVTGLSNLSAVPSVSQAITSVPLNTSNTPLAVLDSNANNGTALIVIGSSYVNSVAKEIFANQPAFNSTFMQGGPNGKDAVTMRAFGTNRILVAGFTAQQTVQAGDEFIAALLANATA